MARQIRRIVRGTVTVGCAAIAILAGAPAGAQPPTERPTSGVDLRPRDGELRIAEGAEVAHLHLSNGSSLHFLEVAPGVIGVLELLARGAASISLVTELPRNATPTDVFFAFSGEGTRIPARLVKAAPASSAFGTQGWARALVNVAPAGSGPCNDADVKSYVNSFGYNDLSTPKFRLNQKPESSSFFEAYDYIPGNGHVYDFFHYVVGGNVGSVFSNIDRYLSYVAVCAIDNVADGSTSNPGGLAHPPVSYQGFDSDHMGPVVGIGYRRPGETAWSWVVTKDFDPPDVGTAVAWHFYTGSNWDWRTEIYWAGGDDRFDIAHAVEEL
jgi:hypothetical protein